MLSSPWRLAAWARSAQQLCEILDIVQAERLVILNSITVDCCRGRIDPMSQAFIQMSKVLAALELSMICECVRSGMANAKAKGKRSGKRPTTKDDIPAVFYRHYRAYAAGQLSVGELACVCGLSRPMVYRYLKLTV